MEDIIRENTTIINQIIKISKRLKVMSITLTLHLQQTATTMPKETTTISSTTKEETSIPTTETSITGNNSNNSTHISIVNMSKPNIQLSNSSNNSTLNSSLRDSTQLLNSLYLSNKLSNSTYTKINLMRLNNSHLIKEWPFNKCRQKLKTHRYSKTLSFRAWSN